MPMSDEAARALRVAVEYNPAGARQLMNILRSMPAAVKYKSQDRYGPLSLMMSSFTTKQITRNVEIPIKKAPFPAEMLPACEIFNEEWQQERFSKQELAIAIELILSEMPLQPLLHDEAIDEQTDLIFTRQGTFLVNPDTGLRQRVDEVDDSDEPWQEWGDG